MSAFAGGIVSADDHIVERQDLFTSRLTGRQKELAPRFENGVWYYEGQTRPLIRFIASAAADPGGLLDPITYNEIRREAMVPDDRLKAMDENGVAASLLFPNVIGTCGEWFLQARDKAVAAACVEAYNLEIIGRWYSAHPKRFIPACILPLWDLASSIGAVGTLAATGARAIILPQNLSAHGLQPIWSEHWTPLLDAVAAHDIAVCVHGFSDDYTGLQGLSPYLVSVAAKTGGMSTLASWICTDVFKRTPTLRVMFTEMGVGWVPWFVRLTDGDLRRYGKEIPFAPTDTRAHRLRTNVGLVLQDEPVVNDADLAQVMMLGADYPHMDGTYPRTVGLAALDTADYLPDEQQAIARGNAERFFRFEAARL